MTRYDDLFNEFTTTESVFASKAALDPLREPSEIVPRTNQERELAGILDGVTDGYLLTTVSVYGPL